jgi:hypothetical protein
MTQKLLFFQSLWAMERRHTDGLERSVEENLRTIAEAGYDGISTHFTDPSAVRRLTDQLKHFGLTIEGQCFPKTIDDLQPVLELAQKFGCHHIDVQPDIRPRRMATCARLIEGWLRLAEQVDFPVLIETHRDRMTTDLYFVLDLLDLFPQLRLTADLSHFLVGREFAWPVDAENHAMIHCILDHSWAMHGRVASREQVQVEISFPHHRMWLELFLDWWEYGMRSWRRRAGADETLAFVCELGPKPYAISGPDGNDQTDRWEEALMLRNAVRERWQKVAAEDERRSGA